MKILRAADIKQVDDYTIAHEPVTSVDLVARVAGALHRELLAAFSSCKKLAIVCGKGKNAADGMALAAALMWESGYTVRALCCYPPDDLCPEAAHFYGEIKAWPMLRCEQVDGLQTPVFERDELIVDGLFGTGLSRPLAGYEKQLVQAINSSGCRVLSVDIPSGMMAEDNAANDAEAVVRAHHTFTLNAPKLAMLLPEYGNYVGQLHVLDIGLHPDAVAQAPSNFYYTVPDDLRKMLKPRDKFSHKGSYGRCLLVAGSQGMMGAAVLASRACLHAGAGLLTAHIPKCGVNILQTAVPEAMLSVDENENHFSGVKNVDSGRYDAVAIGCGLSCGIDASVGLEALLRHAVSVPLVLDADALNIVSGNEMLFNMLPENTIITPHVKEFERLFGACANGMERLQKQQEVARQHRIVVVLKGAHTSVALPSGDVFFSSTGNPGMATAGSGDVLTGVILALLGQGYEPAQAALLGVGLHGMAGDAGAKSKSQMYLTASDIVEHLYVLDHEAMC